MITYGERLVPLLTQEEVRKIGKVIQEIFNEKTQINSHYILKNQWVTLRMGTFIQGSRKYVRIFNFYIHQDFRGRGIGCKIIKGVIEILKEEVHFNYIELQAETMEVGLFWEKVGFQNYPNTEDGSYRYEF